MVDSDRVSEMKNKFNEIIDNFSAKLNSFENNSPQFSKCNCLSNFLKNVLKN